ncbi:hypothetical protein BDW22DRAFT_1417043 [Trametopsis cervina]|nr:hypothetical protein BDW22DRAFT_1417043 [Trametopsis cervina]
MSTPEYFEAQFRWPHRDANDVVVTGEFDAWSRSHHLSRSANGFEGTVQIPWGRKIAYKYIVDGRWTTTDEQPTELDSIGNLNNVLNAPARPPTPKAAPPVLPEEPSPPSAAPSTLGGILTNAKNAAVAMVEALAPGTTETPQPTPAIGHDAIKEQVLDTVAEVKEKVLEPTSEPTPAEEPVPTPKEEVNVEAVLPVAPEEAEAAPVVPVPVLPLAEETNPSTANGHAGKPLDTTIVEGSTTSETQAQAEPSTHTPVVPAPEPETPPAFEPSTHTPAPNGSASPARTETPKVVPESASPTAVNDTLDQPSTHTPVVLPPQPEPAASAPEVKEAESVPVSVTNGVNGNHTEKPAEIALPPATPSEVPLPPTPAANGKPSETPSATSSPPNSPRKERRSAFPTFGRHHRQSSSTSVSTSVTTPDEHGAVDPVSRKGSIQKRRTSSIFGKIKHVFSDEHKKEKKAKEASS